MIKIGRNRNTNDTANVTPFIELVTDLAVEASDADERRIYWSISITTKDAYIRFIPHDTDNAVRKGFLLKKDQMYEMPTDNIYTGKISIINKKDNEKPEFSVTTY